MITENQVVEKIVFGMSSHRNNFSVNICYLRNGFGINLRISLVIPFSEMVSCKLSGRVDAGCTETVDKTWGTHDGKQKDMFTFCFIQCENTTHTCPGYSTDSQPVRSYLTPFSC